MYSSTLLLSCRRLNPKMKKSCSPPPQSVPPPPPNSQVCSYSDNTVVLLWNMLYFCTSIIKAIKWKIMSTILKWVEHVGFDWFGGYYGTNGSTRVCERFSTISFGAWNSKCLTSNNDSKGSFLPRDPWKFIKVVGEMSKDKILNTVPLFLLSTTSVCSECPFEVLWILKKERGKKALENERQPKTIRNLSRKQKNDI